MQCINNKLYLILHYNLLIIVMYALQTLYFTRLLHGEHRIVRFRNEEKYFCTEQELALIESRIKNICKIDLNVGQRTHYTIRSVYFDSYTNSCFYDNENGIAPREKFRIRMYDGNTEHILLECKEKRNGKNHKESSPLSKEQCERMLKGRFCQKDLNNALLTDRQRKLLYKFYLRQQLQLYRAKTVVEYDRTPYVYPAGNVRITFDRNISGSDRVQHFLNPELKFRPVMKQGYHILEVKYDELLPDFLYNAMQLKELQRTAFSKYYICRKFCG